MPLSESDRLELGAVDAALAGDPVDPQYAEFAELALLLADAKPALTVSRAAELDRRVGAMAAAPARTRRPSAPAGRPWFLRPACGAGLAIALAITVLVVVLPHGGASSSSDFEPSSAHSGALTSAGSSAGATAAPASHGTSKSAQGLTLPTPQANGRRVVQSAQLSLSAASPRVATVAQELFDVVGSERGIVQHSQVSTGTGAYASFTLSIPTTNLSGTLARLAQLRYATVTASSALTTDVNNRYLDDRRRLADAEALRRSLLTQLQVAPTTTAIDSLKTQIRDAEAVIAGDESAVNALQGQISFSAIQVTISAAAPSPVAPTSRGHAFTPGRAAHDALDVLRVGAGVGIIALAGLIPLALLAALMAWLIALWRRLARERALDAG